MNQNLNFFSIEETKDMQEFLSNGFIVKSVSSFSDMQKLIDFIITKTTDYLGSFYNEKDILNNLHNYVKKDELNDLRIHIINCINGESWIRETYFKLAKKYIFSIVGNEVAMQVRLNLSIQMPGDSGSLLPVHSDTWSGDSPFEIVVWLPLVDCYRTKSMYLLKNDNADAIESIIFDKEKDEIPDSETIFQKIKHKIRYIEIKKGQILLFNQNLPHGNRINEESETRWSINCRFKGVFTPYADKKLGEFFEPITIRPASYIGMQQQIKREKN